MDSEFAILDARHGSIRDLVCFIGAEPTRLSQKLATSQLTQFVDDTQRQPFVLVSRPRYDDRRTTSPKWVRLQSLWDLEAEYVFNGPRRFAHTSAAAPGKD